MDSSPARRAVGGSAGPGGPSPERRDAIVEVFRPGDVLVGHLGRVRRHVAADAVVDKVGHTSSALVAVLPREGRTYPGGDGRCATVRTGTLDGDVGEMLGYRTSPTTDR